MASRPPPAFTARTFLAALLTAVILALLPWSVRAQEPGMMEQLAGMPLPPDQNVKVGQLDNGLTYYIRSNARPEDRAELRLVVNAGSVLEEDDQLGLAHLLEHMAFNGTENFEKQELIDYLEGIGMEFGPSVNAFTSFDETVYMLTVPTDSAKIVETAFQILEDWAHNLSLDPAEIDKERGVVIEEWRLGLGAGRRMLDRQLPILFKDSRYANRLPIGDPEILESFAHERLISFYQDWYRPDLMAVVAVGDFDPARIEELIRTHFSRVEPVDDPRPRRVFEVPGHRETLFAIATDPEATSNQVAVTYKQPMSTTETVGDYRRVLIERLYNSMLNDRLRELSQQGADAPFVFAASSKGRFVRSREVYQLFAGVRDGGISTGLEALLTEAARVSRHGFTVTELERKKIDVLRGLESAFTEREKQESRRYAGEYVNAFLQGEPITGIEFEYQAAQRLMPTITLEDVDALADEWITDANRVILVNAPDKEGVPVPGEAELLSVFEAVAAKDVEPYEDEVSDAPLVAETPNPGAVVEEETVEEIGVTRWTLENGVQVILKPTDFKEDEIRMQAYSFGGTSLAPLEVLPSANFASAIVGRSGLGEFDNTALDKRLAGTVANVGAGITSLTESLSGSASPKDLETWFQLIHLKFTGPRKDADAFGAFKQQVESFLANRSASPSAAFQDTLSVTVTGHHPRRPLLSLELMSEVELDEAFDFYRDRFADAGDFTFVFVGNFDTQEIRPLVETWLGGLPSTGREETFRDEGVRPPEGVVEKEVYKGVEPQSRTQVIFSDDDFAYTPENRLHMRLMAEALQIRLREIMREDLGGTYSVGSRGSYSRYPEQSSTFTVSFGSDPERAEELRNVVFSEIERFKEDGPTADELQKVKEQERRSRETNLKQNGYWASQLMSADQNGFDPRSLTDYSLIDAVTAEDLRRAARQWIDTERYVQVVLYPEDRKAGPDG